MCRSFRSRQLGAPIRLPRGAQHGQGRAHVQRTAIAPPPATGVRALRRGRCAGPRRIQRRLGEGGLASVAAPAPSMATVIPRLEGVATTSDARRAEGSTPKGLSPSRPRRRPCDRRGRAHVSSPLGRCDALRRASLCGAGSTRGGTRARHRSSPAGSNAAGDRGHPRTSSTASAPWTARHISSSTTKRYIAHRPQHPGLGPDRPRADPARPEASR